MMFRLIPFLLLALFAFLSPLRQAYADTPVATWQEASANCQAHLASMIAHEYPNGFTFTDCYRLGNLKVFVIHYQPSNNDYTSCGTQGDTDPSLGSCAYTGADPPICTKDGSLVPVATYRWADGTECDGQGCALGEMLGGVASGQDFRTGQYCPYDPNSYPPDAPPAPPPSSSPPPPECNADGSCTVCAGDLCATTGGKTDPGPPPASDSSSGDPGNHNSDSGTNYNYNGPWSAGSSGSPGSGSSSGGAGTGSSSGGTGSGSGNPGPPSSSDTKCTTGVCDVGEADGAMGGMYQHSDQTIAGVFGGYMNTIKAAPIVASAGAFFTVSAGGSCPSWHIPGNEYWGPAGFDFSFFCSSSMLTLFELAGFLVLAAGAFCAFRIALY